MKSHFFCTFLLCVCSSCSSGSGMFSQNSWKGHIYSSQSSGTLAVILDEQDRKVLEKTYPETLEKIDQREPLAVIDIISLHEGGVSDEVILEYVRHTRGAYNLTHNEIRKMQIAGISQKLINYLIDTGR